MGDPIVLLLFTERYPYLGDVRRTVPICTSILDFEFIIPILPPNSVDNTVLNAGTGYFVVNVWIGKTWSAFC